ncbi:MAG: hypothetical protein ACE5FU_12805 [Nitrospinota bacterium]
MNVLLNADNIPDERVFDANIRRAVPHWFLQDRRKVFLRLEAFS